jgi:hypothetical protein
LLANKAPNIHYATSCCYIPRKRLGALKKKKEKKKRKNKRKRTNVPLKKKIIEQPKFSPKSLSFRERYEKNSQRS